MSIEVPDSNGLRLMVVRRNVNTEQLPSGTLAVSVFFDKPTRPDGG